MGFSEEFCIAPWENALENDPEWFYPEMCLNGVNTQWMYSQGVIQKPLEFLTISEHRLDFVLLNIDGLVLILAGFG